MDYQALYRKYRPQRFDEIIGQDHVTKTLSREIVEGKIAHAYLFAGPRGTGKTTSARLLAKSINCTDLQDNGEPCNVCHSCAGITDGHSLDVIELDAASHNKVEDIREIRMNVGTVAAAGGAHRVYILDEAHMLSRAAGNALLKTLEEPPEHVIFVLATTEPYKMLDTIRSRSQRFDFHPVSAEVLIDHLQDISDREGFTPEPEGLAMVAMHARGSVRDALSLLEQVAALGAGRVEASAVARALGLADREAFASLAEAIANQDAPSALGLVARLAAQGADLRRFVSEALEFFRGVFLAQYAPNLEELVDDSHDTIDEWRRHATALAPADVLRSIDQLAEALTDLRQGREERLVVELALLRLTRPETVADPSALDARLSRLESSVRQLAAAPPPAAPQARPSVASPPKDPPSTIVDDEPAAAEVSPVEAAPELEASASSADNETPARDGEEADTEEGTLGLEPAEPAPVLEPLTDLDLAGFEAVWPALVAQIRDRAGPRRHAWLKESMPVAVNNGTVALEVPAHLPFHLEQLKADHELVTMVRTVAADLLGGSIEVAFRQGAADDSVAPDEPTRAPDKELLAETNGDPSSNDDPASLIVEELGGEIISE
jgi:DNA polymerase-3 subunit gamma/tau